MCSQMIKHVNLQRGIARPISWPIFSTRTSSWSLYYQHKLFLLPTPVNQARYLRVTGSERTQSAQHKSSIIADADDTSSVAKKKHPRSPGANASLRRVAFEAERSRGRMNDDVRLRDSPMTRPEYERKTVTAFCAAEQYRIERVASTLQDAGHSLDPFHTDLYPQVIHFQMHSTFASEPSHSNSQRSTGSCGDVFVFPSGTVVAWNVDENRVKHLVTETLTRAAIKPHLERLETEDLEYIEDPTIEKSSVVGDTIRIGVRPSRSSDVGHSNTDPSHTLLPNSGYMDDAKDGLTSNGLKTATIKDQHVHNQNLALAKIAFSSGLARSTKIAVLESLLDNYFANTQRIPSLLSTGSRLPYNRAFMLRKTGELLSVRAQLNMTELTDRLPDLFWDSRHELGLEGYFDQLGRALDVGIRIKTLNERMDYAQEIATVLRENLSERHGLLLEWLIIGLIAVEVGVEGWKILKELQAGKDPSSTENLVRSWLEGEIDQNQLSKT